MGIRKAIAFATQEHKDKISSPYFLFSAQNPKHPEQNSLKLEHDQILQHLRGAGYDAHEIEGSYGSPEKAIIIYGLEPQQMEELHQLAAKLGQDSSISSDGEKHEMRFHHGDHSGQKLQGCGLTWHQGRPQDQYSSLPGGQHHFTHNFDKVENYSGKFLTAQMNKSEKMSDYKKNAAKGLGLMYPAKIDGEDHIEGTDIRYHVTVKGFDADSTDQDKVKEMIDSLEFKSPSPETPIELIEFTTDVGNTYKMVLLHGAFEDHIKELASIFDGMGIKYKQNLGAHMTVGEKVWKKLKDKDAKTLEDAGIQFEKPELWRGNEVLEKYTCQEIMEKGFGQKAMATLGVIGSLAGAPKTKDLPVPHAEYSSKRMLQAISDVESSGGKNTRHKELEHGIHAGDTAYGKFGLTPTIVRETIKLNRDLKSKHGKAMKLEGTDLNRYLSDNPGLEDQIASKHLSRLEHHFGRDPAAIGYAWLNGVKGTYQAKKQKKDIQDHWHVKKIKQAYTGEK